MKRNITTIIIFCAFIFGLGILNILKKDSSYSSEELRSLETNPPFSFKSLFEGSVIKKEKDENAENYTKKFERYTADQFPFRAAFVGLKTLTDYSLQKKDSGGVYFANDKSLIAVFSDYDETRLEKNLSYAETFLKNAAALGVPAKFMLVPTAAYDDPERLPKYAEAAPIDLNAIKNNNPDFIIPRNLEYYKTDHHWTTGGAFSAYNAYREALGLAPADDNEYAITLLAKDFHGSLYRKNLFPLAPYDTIEYRDKGEGIWVKYLLRENETFTSILENSWLSTQNKYAVFLDDNQPLVTISTNAKNDKRLLLIKDSYANCFVPFLFSDYEQIDVIDLRFYKASLKQFIADNKITDALVLYNIESFAQSPDFGFITR